MSGWQLAVDQGGTFTDVVAIAPDGSRHLRKVLSSAGPAQVAGAVLAELAAGQSPESLRVGTTIATNAMLTGAGAAVGLLVSRGFADALIIGHQQRAEIFELFPASGRLDPLTSSVVEVDERVLFSGEVERELNRQELLVDLVRLRDAGVDSLAVGLVHSYLYPRHELEIAELAKSLGFTNISLSHCVLPRCGLVDRLGTTVADAFLAPVLAAYVEQLIGQLPAGTELRLFKSSGGLSQPADLLAVDAVLSGPAGGAVACAELAGELGLAAVIGLDMGGTSSDVCRWAGALEIRDRVELAGREIHCQAVDVVTVAAGGGSLLTRRMGRLQVGPGSAGSRPGPACYGAGGPAALTDANLVLGRLQVDRFPHSFGPSGAAALDPEASARALLDCAGAEEVELLELAAGFVAIANQRMAEAISEVSTARGHDPREHALIAFGGAAAQHVCAVAEQLGIGHVVLPPMAGLLSAWGISRAKLHASRRQAVDLVWSAEELLQLAPRLAELEEEVRSELISAGANSERLSARIRYLLRYEGSDTELLSEDLQDFLRRHAQLFGLVREGRTVELRAIQVDCWELAAEQLGAALVGGLGSSHRLPPERRRIGFVDGLGRLQMLDARVVDAESLAIGQVLCGPALVSSAFTTLLVDPGWQLDRGSSGEFNLRWLGRQGETTDEPQPPSVDSALKLELGYRRLQSMVTRMGELLRRVAWSTNIKERLDFSCAVFDGSGQLVSNAPHIPVHLGAMGATVRHLLSRPDRLLADGQCWAVNDPSAGGSHLPDITVITPVFFGQRRPQAFVACRAHHADVGGVSPGSMPPFSRQLVEEGVLLDAVLVADAEGLRPEPVRSLLCGGPHPSRRPDQCLADLAAQVRANQLGVGLLNDWVQVASLDSLRQDMAAILDNGRASVQRLLQELELNKGCFSCAMDDGSPVCVSLQIAADGDGRHRLTVDFEGTADASAGNLNAPPAVVIAATIYVLRALIGEDIPLSDGCLRDVELRVPPGSLLAPPRGAAVVGGNVETSQRIVDVLLGALGVSAAAQGTMNNLCLGGSELAYYETICGGTGAGPAQAGSDAVHSHMTNTRITDVEVLERNYPVVLKEFSVRRGSGGRGRWAGGDGARRVFQFRAPLEVSLLAQRRVLAPFGLQGGGAGAVGRSVLWRAATGRSEELSGSFALSLSAGDQLCIETPGGGGWGEESS